MTDIDFAEAKRIFFRTKAIITGDHFVYAKKADGWYHGSDYVNKDAIFPFAASALERLAKIIALHFKGRGIGVVVGPTMGGALLAQPVARHLTNMREPHGGAEVFSVFADEVNEARIIKRGYDAYVRGAHCLIVEDVINSGNTVAKTSEAVNAHGRVIAIAALCNRSGGIVTAKKLGVPELACLIDVNMKMYKEEDCPICKEKGVRSVRTDLGKGMEFLIRIRA